MKIRDIKSTHHGSFIFFHKYYSRYRRWPQVVRSILLPTMAEVAQIPDEMDTQTGSNPNAMDAQAENEENPVAEPVREASPKEPEEVGSETLYIQNLNDKVKISCQ